MGTIVCVRCGRSEDEASASFGEEGLECARCHGATVAGDAAQMQAQVAQAAAVASGAAWSGASDERPRPVVARRPLTGASARLAERGLLAQRADVTESVEIAGIASRSSSGYQETWTLPAPSPVQASFAREGLGAKITKLFRREIQTGDRAFDDAVYVSTTTPDATTALLARPEVRDAIFGMVTRGGSLRIEGKVVEAKALWPDEEVTEREDDLIARVVAALLPD